MLAQDPIHVVEGENFAASDLTVGGRQHVPQQLRHAPQHGILPSFGVRLKGHVIET
jgi:hypothetical protein